MKINCLIDQTPKKDQDISEKDYGKVIKVWNSFEIKHLGEYHALYLKTDVLLLCDVFEKFVKTCLDYYRLDPCHYFSSPGLSWDAMLKMTGVRLHLISDVNMHLFIEKGMRGGISYIAKRHGKANNEYMENYDSNEDSKSILYIDANNLYGWAMDQPLSYSGFSFLSEK